MRILVAVAFLFLCVASPAGARSFSVPANVAESEVGNGADSVALVDGGVVWLEQRGTAAALVFAGEDAVPRDVMTLPAVTGPQHFHAVVGAGTTAFVRRLVCASASCTRNAADELLRVDLTTGAAAPFDGCLGDRECRRAGCSFGLGLRGSVLHVNRCGPQSGVTDLADGAIGQVDGRILDAAGSYALTYADARTGAQFNILDWRTGVNVRSFANVDLDPRVRGASIAADGTLAWGERRTVKVLAPGAAEPRAIELGEGNTIDRVSLAGGKIAIHRTDFIASNELRVSSLDGSGARRLDAQRGRFGWAFDGARLAWVAQPCALPQIQVWDLATTPPVAANDRCIRARLASSSLRLNRAGTRFTVKLTCPPSPARGCAGEFGANVYGGGRKLVETYWQEYRIAAGASATQTLRILRHNRLRGVRRLVARVTVENSGGQGSTKRLRLRPAS